MITYTKITLVTFAVALFLAVCASPGAARYFSSSFRQIRAVWGAGERLRFFNAGGVSIECRVTFEGSFHSATFPKVPEMLVGYITRVEQEEAGSCIKQNVTNAVPLSETLPWHIRYDSFEGRLPEIVGIRFRLIDLSILVTVFGVNCLYRSTVASPAHGIANRELGGGITGLRADEASTIPKRSGGVLCPNSANSSHTGIVTRLGETGVVSVELI